MATVERAPDTELLLRLRSRDRTAWEELYAEYQPRLRAFAYRLSGNVHDADDLVQETFVRAVPRLDRLDPATVDLGAYLFTTCKNLFYKQVEKSKRAEPMADVPEPIAPMAIDEDPGAREPSAKPAAGRADSPTGSSNRGSGSCLPCESSRIAPTRRSVRSSGSRRTPLHS